MINKVNYSVGVGRYGHLWIWGALTVLPEKITQCPNAGYKRTPGKLHDKQKRLIRILF